MRKGLCSKNKVLSNSEMTRFNRDECPLCGFMAAIIDQQLQRAYKLDRRDGVVVRASALQSVDLGFIP